MITSVEYTNFKSLKKVTIPFNKLTILAGLNSAGKSSVIQGLLLSRSLADYLHGRESLEIADIKKFPLNGDYLLSLGSAMEAVAKDTGKQFEISVNGIRDAVANEFRNVFYTSEALSDTLYDMSVKVGNSYKSSFMYETTLYYLNAERLGPRIRHRVNEKGGVLNCGYRGEYTVEVLAHAQSNPDPELLVNESKFLNGRRLEGFQDIPKYARAWMEYITPGADLGAANIIGKIRSAEISVNGNTPPNVGFGISYVLPIIVTGLLAKPGAVMIVENPEAHLHPKGQSNLGFFLGQIASSGVQIVIETHSEHIINGIRRATLSFSSVSPSDMTISFFKGVSENKDAQVDTIVVNREGSLSTFPVDFFDQVNQDMAEVSKLKSRRNGEPSRS